MSLTWNFRLILFLFLSLGVFPPGSWLNQKKKVGGGQGGLHLPGAGFELATPRLSIMNVKIRKRMLYFALREEPKPSQIESSNLGIVLLQVIGSWVRAKLGGQSHEEAGRAVTWGGSRGSFTMKFYFIYYTVERNLGQTQNPSHLRGCYYPRSRPIRCFTHTLELPMCVPSGSLFRTWNPFLDEWSRPCAKGYMSALHTHGLFQAACCLLL